MSKEIKEKCKECAYYNDKQQYPDVDGATTHLNCLSIKCQYRKITKDMQISRLKHNLSDLEAKLAESFTEKDVEGLIKDREETIKFLKQQLAEKDKENELMAETLRMTKCIEKEINQDKISFALEQLEKVKEFFLKEERDEEMDTDYVITKENWEIAGFLLDQIKAIKGEK